MKCYKNLVRNLLLITSAAMVSLPVPAQEKTVYETSGGSVFKNKFAQNHRLPAKQIFSVFAEIPFLSQPQGYDVIEGVNVLTEGGRTRGFISIGLPRYFRFGGGKLHRQDEFYHIYTHTNYIEPLYSKHDRYFPEETDKLNYPLFFTDTFLIHYSNMNAAVVGRAQDNFRKEMFILNPSMKPFFLSVSKETLCRFWIDYLTMLMKEEKRMQERWTKELPQYAGKPNLADYVKGVKEAMQVSSLWVAFYLERISYYEQKLKTMSPTERQSGAHTIARPRRLALAYEYGKMVQKITGHMLGELADDAGALMVRPLYYFNPEFFNDKLPPDAIQLMIITESVALNRHTHEFVDRVHKQVFPYINFSSLMKLLHQKE